MGNLLAAQGGIKSVTHYEFDAGLTANSDWSQSVTITAVSDVSKTVLLSTFHTYGGIGSGTGGSQMAIRLASTTSVEYIVGVDAALTERLAFQVIEYY